VLASGRTTSIICPIPSAIINKEFLTLFDVAGGANSSVKGKVCCARDVFYTPMTVCLLISTRIVNESPNGSIFLVSIVDNNYCIIYSLDICSSGVLQNGRQSSLMLYHLMICFIYNLHRSHTAYFTPLSDKYSVIGYVLN
jgi:hypothetical protein